MEEKIEQRICIKFCVKNAITRSDTLKMLQKCYGDATLSKTRVNDWYGRVESGRADVHDDVKTGRPSTSKTEEIIQKVKSILAVNRKITITEIVDEALARHTDQFKAFCMMIWVCNVLLRV